MADCVVLQMTVTLYQGDCLEILPTLAAQSVDAILTDLPYGTTACSWDEVIPFEPMWREVKRILKPRGVFVTTASQPFTSKLVMSNPDMFRYEWIWRKSRPTNFLDAKRKPLKEHENIIVFSLGSPVYYPVGLSDVNIKSGRKAKTVSGGAFGIIGGENYIQTVGNFPRTVIEVPSINDYLHPTQKPVALYEYLIRTYTNAGDTVLDFCAGSGTTGVAAINTGRNAILIEREPKYCEIIQRRIEQAQAQMVMELDA